MSTYLYDPIDEVLASVDVGEVLPDEIRDVPIVVLGEPRAVGGDENVLVIPKRGLLGQRFRLEDIECSATERQLRGRRRAPPGRRQSHVRR